MTWRHRAWAVAAVTFLALVAARYDPRFLLFVYYGLRGVSLLIHGPGTDVLLPGPRRPRLGRHRSSDDGPVSRGLPAAAIERGLRLGQRGAHDRSWVLGRIAGWVRESTGPYDIASWTTGMLALLAAVMVLVIPKGRALVTSAEATDLILTPG